MKARSFVVWMLLGLCSSCSNQSQAFAIEKFWPLSSGCAIPDSVDTLILSGGTLDVAAGDPTFSVGFRIQTTGTLGPEAVTLRTGEILDQEGRNRPVITQQVVSYRLRRPGVVAKPYLTNRSLLMVEGRVDGPIQLISPALGASLFDSLTASNNLEDFVDVTADVEFLGEFAATRTPFTTGTLSLPIRVFRSLPPPCANASFRYRRYPFFAIAGDPNSGSDSCRYVGQRYELSGVADPPNPADCCEPGTAGC
jgi:hypothetical protein